MISVSMAAGVELTAGVEATCGVLESGPGLVWKRAKVPRGEDNRPPELWEGLRLPMNRLEVPGLEPGLSMEELVMEEAAT